MKRTLSLICALVMMLTAASALAAGWSYEDLALDRTTNRWGYEISWDYEKKYREWKPWYNRYPTPTPIVTPDGSAAYYGWYYGPGFVTPAVETKPAEKQNSRGGIGNIVWSGEYLKQVWLNNKGIDFRIFADGERVSLKETVSMKEDGSYRLNLVIRAQSTDVKPVLTIAASEFLRSLNITEVNVKGPMFDQSYSLDDLSALAN